MGERVVFVLTDGWLVEGDDPEGCGVPFGCDAVGTGSVGNDGSVTCASAVGLRTRSSISSNNEPDMALQFIRRLLIPCLPGLWQIAVVISGTEPFSTTLPQEVRGSGASEACSMVISGLAGRADSLSNIVGLHEDAFSLYAAADCTVSMLLLMLCDLCTAIVIMALR